MFPKVFHGVQLTHFLRILKIFLCSIIAEFAKIQRYLNFGKDFSFPINFSANLKFSLNRN